MQISSICHLCLSFWSSFGVFFSFFFWGLLSFSSLLCSRLSSLVSRLLVGELGHRRFSPSPALHPRHPLPSPILIITITRHPSPITHNPSLTPPLRRVFAPSRPSYWRHMQPLYQPAIRPPKMPPRPRGAQCGCSPCGV